jgi:hypothetical protein
MKRTIRLTESDLTRLVMRVINEGAIPNFNPDDARRAVGKSGTFTIDKDGSVLLKFNGDNSTYYISPSSEDPYSWD